MLQIKTIKRQDPELFDMAVNEALAEGWTLSRRLTGPDVCIAELEREIITEGEKTCENCKHSLLTGELEPCASCPNGEKWEAAE